MKKKNRRCVSLIVTALKFTWGTIKIDKYKVCTNCIMLCVTHLLILEMLAFGGCGGVFDIREVTWGERGGGVNACPDGFEHLWQLKIHLGNDKKLIFVL